MIIFTLCALLVVSSCMGNPVSDDEYFRKYIKNINSRIDDTIKPCENFGKYACGNLINDDTSKTIKQMDELVKEQVKNNINLHTDDEQMIRNLYMSCKKGKDITKILEQVDPLKSITIWPVNKDHSDKEIAYLFGYLATVDIRGFLGIDLQDLGENDIITITLKSKFYSNEAILDILMKFGGDAVKNIKIVENIMNLIQQLRDIETDKNDAKFDKLDNVAALKEAVPNFDWDTYFTTIGNVFDIDKDNLMAKPVQCRGLENLKKIVDIIKSTDSKTVVNYIIWKFVNEFTYVNCEQMLWFLNPLIAIQNITNENDQKMNFFLQEIELFQHVEKSFSELKSQINPSEQKRLDRVMKIKKYSYENYEKFLSGKFFSNIIKFNENTLYTNLIKIMHSALKDFLANAEHEDLTAFYQFLMYPVTKYVIRGKEDKSLLENFVIDNTVLWTEIYDEDKFENRTISDGCFPYEGKFTNYKNVYCVRSHAAYHIALQDYLHFVNGNQDQFKKHTEILTEAGLNHEKAFMLALAQERCVKLSKKNLDDDDKLLWFFKHSKHFSDTWGCAADDAMNKVCDDSTFVANFK